MKEPLFAVQVTNRDDSELHKITKALDKAGCEWKDFGVIPFTTEITNKEAFPLDRPVIPLCATKVLDIFMQMKLPANWWPFYDMHGERFNQDMYMRGPLNEFLVNGSAQDFPFHLHKYTKYKRYMFVKPVDDRKAFPGLILTPGQCLDDVLQEQSHAEICEDQRILVGPLVEINKEFRLCVVNEKVISASEYRSRHSVAHKEVSEYQMQALVDFHASFSRLFKSAGEPYVVDVVETFSDEGMKLKIMEFRCLNCCGFYKMDCAAVFRAIKEYVQKFIV